MSRLPVDRRASTWLLFPDESPIIQPPLPVRHDLWDEPITVREIAKHAIAAAIFLPLFLIGLGFFIVAFTPAP